MKPALASALAALLALAAPSSAGEINGPLILESFGNDSAIPTALQAIARDPALELAPEIQNADLGFYALLAAGLPRVQNLGVAPQRLVPAVIGLRRKEAAAYLRKIEEGTTRRDAYDQNKITALAALHVLSPLLDQRQRETLADLSSGAQEEIARREAAFMDRKRAPLAVEGLDPGELVSQFAAQSQGKISSNLTEYENALLQQKAARVDWTLSPDYAQPLLSLAHRERPLREMIASVERRGVPLHFAYVGSGLGSALGQWADENPDADAVLTAVDIFNWRELAAQRAQEDATVHRNTVDSDCLFPDGPNHNFMLADAATVRFPKPQNFILMSGALRFMPDKLEVLLNLYNQLETGGIMAVLSSNWTRMIRMDSALPIARTPIIVRLIAALVLSEAEVVGLSADRNFSVANMGVLLVRRHSTRRVSAPHIRLADVKRNPDGSSDSLYAPSKGSTPEQAFNTPFTWTDSK